MGLYVVSLGVLPVLPRNVLSLEESDVSGDSLTRDDRGESLVIDIELRGESITSEPRGESLNTELFEECFDQDS